MAATRRWAKCEWHAQHEQMILFERAEDRRKREELKQSLTAERPFLRIVNVGFQLESPPMAN